MTAIPSVGVRSPSDTACNTAAAACAASWAVFIGGIGNWTGLSFLGGAILSMQSRKAVVSPAKANSTARCVKACACPSSKSKTAKVVRLRAPAGLPVLPAAKRPAVSRPFNRQTA